MSLKFKRAGVFEDLGGGPTPPAVTPWVRPSDWSALPAVNVGDQKFVGLHSVYQGNSNFVALNVSGDYTVDWGDGTTPDDVAAGVQIDHNFLWANVSPDTLTSGGYRQAVVTITMQSGQTFTALDLGVKHSQTGLNAYVGGWLDICMAGSSLTTLSISSMAGATTQNRLQQFEYVGTSGIASCIAQFYMCTMLQSVVGTDWTSESTTFMYAFAACQSLQTIPLLDTSEGTDFTYMFLANGLLKSIPLLDTAKGTVFTNMFNGCYSLQSIPLLDTSVGTDFSHMFDTCVSLKTIPLLDTSAGTAFSNMFFDCYNLETIPLIDTSAGTDFHQMFNWCYTLQTIPLLDTSSGTDFHQMFFKCYSMETIPLIDTSAGTDFSNMFCVCGNLKSIPLIDTSVGTVFNSMFKECNSLETIPFLDTSSGTDFTDMFDSCTDLQTLPLLDVSSATSGSALATMLDGCPSLQVGAFAGTKVNISYAGCQLSGAQLDAIYTNLASGVVGKTVTVSDNWGVDTDTPSIATIKGWTVTG